MICLKGQGWARIRIIETWRLFSKIFDTWYNNRILLIGPPFKENRGGTFTRFLRCTKQGHSFNRLNNEMWARGLFLPLSDDYDARPLVQGFYWLANQSREVVSLDHPIKKKKKQNKTNKTTSNEEVDDRRLVPLSEEQSLCRRLYHPKSWTWLVNQNFHRNYLDRFRFRFLRLMAYQPL